MSLFRILCFVCAAFAACPGHAANPAMRREYIIVEFNAATRAPPIELPEGSDEQSIRHSFEVEEIFSASERRYVAAKVAEWKSRFLLPDGSVELLHPAGTGPYVIEASPQNIAKIISDASSDSLISVMPAAELLNFDRSKLNPVFASADSHLLGEFVESHFKNEMMFAVWNAEIAGPTFSNRPVEYQHFVKAVANVALEKMYRLEQYLKRRRDRYRPDIIMLNRLAKKIQLGYIRLESFPASPAFPTPSEFFERLELFDHLGLKILLQDGVPTGKIIDRWIKLHARESETPHTERKIFSPTHGLMLGMLGHKTPSIRDKFALDLASFILDHEDSRRIMLTGPVENRIIRLALAVAQSREESEYDQKLDAPSKERLKRRYEIAEEILRTVEPSTRIVMTDTPADPPPLLFDLVNDLVRVDLEAMKLGDGFSPRLYRVSALRVLSILIVGSKNARFRDHVTLRANQWLARMRNTNQDKGIERNVDILEERIKEFAGRTCEGLFKSRD